MTAPLPAFLGNFNGLTLLVIVVVVGLIIACCAAVGIRGEEAKGRMLADEEQEIADDEPTWDLPSDYGDPR